MGYPLSFPHILAWNSATFILPSHNFKLTVLIRYCYQHLKVQLRVDPENFFVEGVQLICFKFLELRDLTFFMPMAGSCWIRLRVAVVFHFLNLCFRKLQNPPYSFWNNLCFLYKIIFSYPPRTASDLDKIKVPHTSRKYLNIAMLLYVWWNNSVIYMQDKLSMCDMMITFLCPQSAYI